jgi:hypothetical protein
MDHGDGDHHDEQFDGDGDPQGNNGLYQVICVNDVLTMFYFHVRFMFLSTCGSEVE